MGPMKPGNQHIICNGANSYRICVLYILGDEERYQNLFIQEAFLFVPEKQS